PGGTTVAALGVLDERGLDDTVAAAVAAAVARAKELGA
ncbi:MAG: pyrroline-5-carboxylate reductase, partial [Actinobacteria bacterium]